MTGYDEAVPAGRDLEDAAVDPLRDDLARALASETVREIVEQITTQSGDAPSCPGQTFDPPCGACPACMIAQATVHLHTDEGWRELQAQADRLLVHVHAQAAYRAARDAAPADEIDRLRARVAELEAASPDDAHTTTETRKAAGESTLSEWTSPRNVP